MSKILVVGSINMDMVINTDKMPKLGETINGSGFCTIPGGKGENQAIAAARLGGKVSMIGSVGNDLHGERLKQNLIDNNINIDGVVTTDTNSGVAMITVCRGDNYIILDKGANDNVSVDLIENCKDLIKKTDIVVMQFEIPIKTVLYTAKLAKSLNKTVIINPAPMAEFPHELFAYTDIFVPNQYEAAELLGFKVEAIEDGKKAVQKLYELGVSHPIVTMGEQGCIYLYNNTVIHKPAFSIKAVDTTAAGDSFIGAISKALCDGMELNEAINYATAVSAITVSRMGATSSLPTADEVEEFLSRIDAL